MKITDAINQVTESHPIQFAHPSQDYIYCVPVLTEGDLKFKVITCDSGCLGDGMLPGYMTGLTQQTWVHSLCLCTSASHTVSLHTGHRKEIILAHIVKMIACNSQHLVSLCSDSRGTTLYLLFSTGCVQHVLLLAWLYGNTQTQCYSSKLRDPWIMHPYACTYSMKYTWWFGVTRTSHSSGICVQSLYPSVAHK